MARVPANPTRCSSGFTFAVHDALGVGVGRAREDLGHDSGRFRLSQPPALPRQVLAERATP